MNNSYFQYLCSQLENEFVRISFKSKDDMIGKIVKTSEGYLIDQYGCLFKVDYKQVKDIIALRK